MHSEFRVIGNAPETEKVKVQDELMNKLFSHYDSLTDKDREMVSLHEYAKTDTEIELINFANDVTGQLMSDLGIVPYDIPQDNYHLLPKEFYSKLDGNYGAQTYGAAFPTQQGILMNVDKLRPKPVSFGAVALHETMHLKGSLTMEVNAVGKKIVTTPYRMGLSVKSLQSKKFHRGHHKHFEGLHEAIVSQVEKRYMKQLLDLPSLAEEKEWLTSPEGKTMIQNIAEKQEISEDDIIWADSHNKNDWEMVSYLPQRKVLDYVCEEIKKVYPDMYDTKEDVFKEFLKGHFTGQLLTLARLVENTFGKTSFRVLGNMSDEAQSAVLTLETMRKMRLNVLRS